MSHPVWYSIRTIMKYKTKEEKEEMTLDELTAYSRELIAHGHKWDKVTLFVMGVCLGGTICTVLMYAVHVGF
tara:strand:+ start:492 stop:707 length:216 start_codon:yes stop_codon:yes gene_type:complete